MFSFLNPLLLFGLIAGAVPLIIHFLTKRETRKIFFGSIRFLKELEENKRSRINIDFLLLLLLRILIIVFFCAGLARPLTSFGFLGLGNKEAKSIIFLIDNSYSMGYRDTGNTLFLKAKKKAEEIIDGLSLNDEAGIIFFNEKPVRQSIGFTNNKQTLDNILQNTGLSFAKTGMQNALEAANEFFAQAKNSKKELYILSDFQKNGFSDIQSVKGIKVIPLVFRPGVPSNITVTGMEFPNYISSKNTTRINFHIKNTGEEKKLHAILYLEKNKIGETDITIKDDSEGTAVFFYSFPEKGRYKGFLEIEGSDNLKADNRYYFCVEAMKPLQVLLLAGNKENGEENFYIKQALSSTGDSPIILKDLSVEKSDYGVFQSFPVVILNNLPRIDRKLEEALLKFANAGGGILISLGGNISIKDYSGYSSLLPAKLQFKIGSEEETSKYYKIMSFDKSHPVFKIFTAESFASTHFYSFFGTETNLLDLNTRVLARFDDGYPFVIEKKTGLGKVLLFTSSLDSGWSDFPLRKNYLPLLHQAVYYLSQSQELKKRQVILEGEFFDKEPGIDLIKQPDDYIALNLSPEEADLSYVLKDEIDKRLESKNLDLKDINPVLAPKEEISGIFLLLVLILLVLENIISNKDIKIAGPE
ncbi:MAG: BatA domain-containing protein [bacterium]